MRLPASWCRRLPFRLLQRTGAEALVVFRDRRILVPLRHVGALPWLYWRPNWKSDLMAALFARHPGGLLDVGANVGQSLADLIATGHPVRYLGSEPNVRACAFVSEVIIRNGLTDARILPVGLSDRSGVATLHFTSADPLESMASLPKDSGVRETTRQESIWATRFDDIAAATHSGLQVVKIDVEGAELEVLAGMHDFLTARQPAIICEVLHADASVDLGAFGRRMTALAQAIAQLGYRTFRIRKRQDGRWAGLEPDAKFPVARWTSASGESCDYLLAPPRLEVSTLAAPAA